MLFDASAQEILVSRHQNGAVAKKLDMTAHTSMSDSSHTRGLLLYDVNDKEELLSAVPLRHCDVTVR